MKREQAKNSKGRFDRISLWWIYLLIGFVSAVIVGSMGYIYYVGNSMVAAHTPLANAAKDIKLEATTAHLWLEEIISGDRHESIDNVFVHIDRAQESARVMLEGGVGEKGKFQSLRDHRMRQEITEAQVKLAEFRNITVKRWEMRKTAGAGTEIDQQYDAIFRDVTGQTDRVEMGLYRLIERDLRSFRIVQIVLVALCLSVTVIVGVAFGRFLRRRTEDEGKVLAAYEELNASEEKFRSIAEQAVVGIVITQDNKFKYVNEAVSEILEYPVEDILGWQVEEGYLKIVHPKDRALVMEQERRKRTGENNIVTHYAWKAFTKTGRTKCIETYWKPILFDGKGANLMTMIDITERDRAEKAFKRSEKLYRELVASVNGIVWECDARTIEFSFVSKEAERLLGYPVRRWLEEPTFWQDHIHEDDREWAFEFCAKATAEKRDHEFEYRMIAADGRKVWLRDIVHVVVENNEPVKLRGIMTDITDHRMVEEEIVKLAKFPAENPEPMLRISSDGGVLYHNESSGPLLEYWQYSGNGSVGGTARRCIDEALNSSKPVYDEVRCGRKVFSLTYAPVKEAGYVNVYAHDTTEHKQAEEALKDSEERFRRISECAFEGIFMHDKGRIIDANKALAQMSGYKLSELTGMDGLELVAPEERELIAKNLQSEYDKPFEVVGLRKDGSKVPLEIQSKQVSFKGQQMMVVAVRDLTERKRAEEMVRTSQADYQAIFESANDAIFIHDIDTGAILDFNPRMSEMFGYSRDEACDFNVEDLSSGEPPYTQQDAVEWIRKAADGTPQVFEWHCRHKDGRLFWAEVSLKRAKIGGQYRMLAILRDITERKKATV